MLVSFQVDNTRLSMDCEEDALKLFQQTDGKWKPIK